MEREGRGVRGGLFEGEREKKGSEGRGMRNRQFEEDRGEQDGDRRRKNMTKKLEKKGE